MLWGRLRRTVAGCVFATAVAPIALCPSPALAVMTTQLHYLMGTYFQITVESTDPTAARAAMQRCFVDTRSLESIFSRFDARSELSRLNGSAVGDVRLSPEMGELLQRSMALRAATDGAFDVSVGQLTELWRTASRWPEDKELAVALATLQQNPIALQGRVLHRQAAVRLDFDGIAKGYAVDRCVALLRRAGIKGALVNLGHSSLYALGAPSGTPSWEMTLRDLTGEAPLGTLRLRDQAASVSAVFGHAHQIAGQRVGHILDPQTGQPLSESALAVVVGPSATDAEAFSKAVLIRGAAGWKSATAGEWIRGALLVRSGRTKQFGDIDFAATSPARLVRREPVP